jgi:uncharacterized protein (TIGR02466 family)
MNIVQVYSTPLWNSELPDFDTHQETFVKAARNFRKSNPEGVNKSNVGGSYQSPMNLTTEPAFGPLFEFVAQMGMKAAFDMQFVQCDTYLTAAWVNFNDRRSAVNYDHVHQDTFSGVFYLKVPPKSGKLVLTNPGMNPLWQGAMLTDSKNKFNADKLRIEPAEGQIYLWPSYLPHGVEPNDHDDERISISFNVICVPKEHVEHTK